MTVQSGYLRQKQKFGLSQGVYWLFGFACPNADWAVFQQLLVCDPQLHFWLFLYYVPIWGKLLQLFIFHWKNASSREGKTQCILSKGSQGRSDLVYILQFCIFLKHVSSYCKDRNLRFCSAVSQEFWTSHGLSSSKGWISHLHLHLKNGCC